MFVLALVDLLIRDWNDSGTRRDFWECVYWSMRLTAVLITLDTFCRCMHL